MASFRCLHVYRPMNRYIQRSFGLCSELIHNGRFRFREIHRSPFQGHFCGTSWQICDKKLLHQGNYLACKVKNNENQVNNPGEDTYSNIIDSLCNKKRKTKKFHFIGVKKHETMMNQLKETRDTGQLMKLGQEILNIDHRKLDIYDTDRYIKQLDRFSSKLFEMCHSDESFRTKVIHKSPIFKQLVNYVSENISSQEVTEGYVIGNMLRIFGSEGIPDSHNNFAESMVQICEQQDTLYTRLYLDILAASSGIENQQSYITDARQHCITMLRNTLRSTLSTVEPTDLVWYMEKIPEDTDCHPIQNLLLTSSEDFISQMSLPVFMRYLSVIRLSKFKNYSASLKSSISKVLHTHNFVAERIHKPEVYLTACSKLQLYPNKFLSILWDRVMMEDTQSVMFRLNTATNLRWRNKQLLGTVLDKLDTSNVFGLMKATLSFAILDYSGPSLREALEREMADRSFEDFENPMLLVNFAWSLAVLDVWIPNVFDTVLNKTFYSNLQQSLKGSRPHVLRGSHTKLKQIHQYAVIRSRESGSDFQLPFTESPGRFSKKMHAITWSLIEQLFTVPQQTKYLRTKSFSENGIPIDLQIFVDDSGVLQPYSTVINKPGLHKIAVVSLGYFDMTIPEPQPLGVTVLVKRLLEDEGYKVMLIPYHEFETKCAKKEELMAYFTGKVRETVGATKSKASLIP